MFRHINYDVIYKLGPTIASLNDSLVNSVEPSYATCVIYLQKQTVTHSHLITKECPHLGGSGRVDNDIARISLWEWPK